MRSLSSKQRQEINPSEISLCCHQLPLDLPTIHHPRAERPIRTIFIDITTVNDSEAYRLLEIYFKDDMFDEVEVLSACNYQKEIED